MTPASLTTIARRLNYIRETQGPNRGFWVFWLQNFTGGIEGDSWCSDFASMVCHIAYKANPPLKRSGSSHARLTEARAKGLVVSMPKIDCLYFFIDDNGHAHHEGIVTLTTPLTGIAGNTSEDGLSSNGTGVFEHTLNVEPRHVIFVELPQ